MKQFKFILSICLVLACATAFAQTAADYRNAAEQGDATAQYNLGVCYGKGYGVTQDPVQAVYWFRLAATSGDADAQYNLGVCYDEGYGVTQDPVQAVYWWNKAAKQGHVNAAFNLGWCYDEGYGVTQDTVQAVYWFRLAAMSGDADAQCILGNCYDKGTGVTQDDIQAAYWWGEAAKQGLSIAQVKLGIQAYTSGYHEIAYKWFKFVENNPDASSDDLMTALYFMAELEDDEPVNEYVDLGLSVKWATCNLGATEPWEYGGYYQWAGTKDFKGTGSPGLECPYHLDSVWDFYHGFTKYIPSGSPSYWSGSGNPDDKKVLDPSDDVVHIKLGGSWRMPTIDEWRELKQNCTWTWTTVNGVNGYEVTSNKPGYTDKSIFLPAAGHYIFESYYDEGSHGYYWASSLFTYTPSDAYTLHTNSKYVTESTDVRYWCLSVRPVIK